MDDRSNATLLIVCKGDEVLLGTKKAAAMGTGKVNAPGGKFKVGETPAQCAVRELPEEVGIVVREEDLRLVGILYGYAHKKLFQTVYVYRTSVYVGEPKPTDSMDPFWVHKDELPFDRMHEGDRYWFQKAVNGQRFHEAIYYERPGEGFIRHQTLEF